MRNNILSFGYKIQFVYQIQTKNNKAHVSISTKIVSRILRITSKYIMLQSLDFLTNNMKTNSFTISLQNDVYQFKECFEIVYLSNCYVSKRKKKNTLQGNFKNNSCHTNINNLLQPNL